MLCVKKHDRLERECDVSNKTNGGNLNMSDMYEVGSAVFEIVSTCFRINTPRSCDLAVAVHAMKHVTTLVNISSDVRRCSRKFARAEIIFFRHKASEQRRTFLNLVHECRQLFLTK